MLTLIGSRGCGFYHQIMICIMSRKEGEIVRKTERKNLGTKKGRIEIQRKKEGKRGWLLRKE